MNWKYYDVLTGENKDCRKDLVFWFCMLTISSILYVPILLLIFGKIGAILGVVCFFIFTILWYRGIVSYDNKLRSKYPGIYNGTGINR